MKVKKVATKYAGVRYVMNESGDKVFYVRGKVNGKAYEKKVGSSAEGVTAAYASKVRNELQSIKRMGEESPKFKATVYTLRDASKLYFDFISHKSDTDNMKSSFDNHIVSKFGAMELADITTNDIEQFKKDKLNETSFKTGRTLAPATVNRHIDLISAIYNYMEKYHDLNIKNPCKGVARYKTDNTRDRYLEAHEITQLLQAIEEDPKLRKKEMITLFVLLAVTTGARLSSVLNITKADIKGDRISIKDFKNNSTYTAFVHPSVRERLDNAMNGLSPIHYIIGGNVEPMHRSSINKMLQRVLNEQFNVGLETEDTKRRVVIHTLRHTFASLLAISGTPIYTIKTLMNHSEIEMTMRYAKLAPNQGMDAVNNLKF